MKRKAKKQPEEDKAPPLKKGSGTKLVQLSKNNSETKLLSKQVSGLSLVGTAREGGDELECLC